MSNQNVSRNRASGLSIAIAIGVVLLLVFAAKALDLTVRDDLTAVSSTAPVVEDWKGNSGSIPYQQPTRLTQ